MSAPESDELDVKFRKAVKQIQSLPPEGEYKPTNDERLIFYSLFKQATEGPCKQKKPAFYDVIGKLKWEAWMKVSKLSKDEAKKRYIVQFLKAAKQIKDPQSKKFIEELNTGKIKFAAAAGTQNQPVEIYGYPMSQPSRVIVWFCQINSIPYVYHNVDLSQGQQRNAEFKKIHPFQKVPAIVDNGIRVFESHTIVKYLARKYQVSDHWYPSSLQESLVVDEYLDWHHLNTRKALSGLIFAKYLAPKFGISIDENGIKTAEKEAHIALKNINDVWLADSRWIGGTIEPSIADLFAYQEIAQLGIIGFSNLANYPKIVAWIEKIKTLPHYGEVAQQLAPFLTARL